MNADKMFELCEAHDWYFQMRDVAAYDPWYQRSLKMEKEILEAASLDERCGLIYNDFFQYHYHRSGRLPKREDYEIK